MRGGIRRLLGGVSEEKTLFLLQGIALAAFALISSPAIASDQVFYLRLASSIANGGGMGVDGRATAFVTPGFPAILAVFLRVFGALALPAFRVFQAFLLAGTALLLRRMGGLLGLSRNGASVQLLVGFYPPFAMFVPLLLTETVFDFGLCLAVFLVTYIFVTSSVRKATHAGLMLGLVTLTTLAIRPAAVLLIPAALGVVIVAVFRKNSVLLQRARLVLAACLAGVLVFTSLWGLRNVNALGTFVAFSTEGNWVAYCGNLVAESGMGGASNWNRHVPPSTAARIEGMDEVARSRAFGELLRKEVRSDPLGVARLWPLKLLRLWLNLGFPTRPSASSIAVGLFNMAALLAGGVGYVRTFRLGTEVVRGSLTFAAGFVVLLTLLHVATFAVVRYAFPGLLIVFLLAPESVPARERRLG